MRNFRWEKHFFLKISDFCFGVHISVEMHLSVCFLLPINNGFQSKKKQFEWKMLIFSNGQLQIVKMLKRKSEVVEEAIFYTAKIS